MNPTPDSERRLLYIECGTTARSTVHTGIQRAVRSICREALRGAFEFGVDVNLVDFTNDRFQPTTPNRLQPARANIARQAAPGPSRLRLIELAISRRLNSRLYTLARSAAKSLLHKLRPRPPEYKLAPLNAAGQPAILLLLDSTWDNAIWPKIDKFRAEGGIVCAVLYDLIPFTHPETVEENTRRAHTGWWQHVPGRVDAVQCISQTVAQQYRTWRASLAGHSASQEQVGHFYLGAELDESDAVIKVLGQNTPYFMIVGSIEPRKNHATVLDAFDLLWREGLNARLVIVGAFGWKNEAINARIQKHEQLNRRLFFINDASDRDLTALYGKTCGLIISSLAEGFGLPIVEAQLRGVPVICSDIPVFREVAREEACYFETTSPSSLAAAIRAHAMHLQEETPLSSRQTWISWTDSARSLIDNILRLEHTTGRPARDTHPPSPEGS